MQGPATADEVHGMLKAKNLLEKFPLFTAVHRICTEQIRPADLLDQIRNHPEHVLVLNYIYLLLMYPLNLTNQVYKMNISLGLHQKHCICTKYCPHLPFLSFFVLRNCKNCFLTSTKPTYIG